MTTITTHVLDTSRGRPAAAVAVVLERQDEEQGWARVGGGRTDEDGRVKTGLAPDGGVGSGTYRLRFETGAWFRARGVEAFWPEVQIAFEVRAGEEHHHVPLLLSPFGYSTYRGS